MLLVHHGTVDDMTEVLCCVPGEVRSPTQRNQLLLPILHLTLTDMSDADDVVRSLLDVGKEPVHKETLASIVIPLCLVVIQVLLTFLEHDGHGRVRQLT